MKKHLSTLFAALLGLCCLSPGASFAGTLTARLSADGGATWTTVADGSPSDNDPNIGSLSFNAAIGNWVVNAESGQSAPYKGSPSAPFMDLSGVNLSVGPGTIIIQLSQTDFTSAAAARIFTNQVGGTTDGTMIYNTYLDKGNVLFGSTQTYTDAASAGVSPSATASQIITQAPVPTAGPAFAGEVTGASSEAGGAPFSMTVELILTHPAGTQVTSYGDVDQAPAIPAVPSLAVIKQVACLQPTNICSDFGKAAAGFKALTDPAFCYQITVTNTGDLFLTNVMVNDSLLGNVTSNFFGGAASGTLAPHQFAMAYFKLALSTTTTNIAIANALALNTDGTPNTNLTAMDSAVATVDEAAITCAVTLSSPADLDQQPTDNHVLLPGCGEVSTVMMNIMVCNAGASDLTGVMITPPAGFSCNLPGAFDLAKGACTNFQCTITTVCTNQPQILNVSVTGQAMTDSNHCAIYDITSTNIVSVSSACSGTIECAACRCSSSIFGSVLLHCSNTDSNIVGNPGLTNLSVTLYDASSNVVATIATDANGAYSFTNLTAGTYEVVVTPPANYAQSYPNGVTNNQAVVILGICQTTNDIDFGYQDQNLPTIVGIPAGKFLGCNPTTTIPTDASITLLVTASDDRGPVTNITVTHVDATNGCGITRCFTITAMGTCGSASGHTTFTWTVDNSTPVVTYVPAGTNFGCNPMSSKLRTDMNIACLIKATDDCGLASTNVSHSDVTTPCSVTRTFTVTVTDNCGHTSAPKTVVDTWTIDTTLPVITMVPAGTNFPCNPAAALLPTDALIQSQVIAMDNCGLVLTNVSHIDVTNGCNVTRTFSIYVVDHCSNTSAVKTVVFTWKSDLSKPVVTCPPDITISNAVVHCTTYTPGDYCTTGNNACTTLANCFKKLYPNGYVQCGVSVNGYCAKFTSPAYCQKFEACNSTPGCFKYNYNNPSTCEAGSFAAHVLCLQFDVDLGDNQSASGFSGGCGDLVLNDCTSPLNGKHVRDILAICHKAVGGCDVSSYGCSLSYLYGLCSNLNQSCQNGNPSAWCNSHLVPPSVASVPPSVSGTATVSDGCSGSPTLTYSDAITCGACAGTYTIARTWSAVDACGNSNSCTQIISVGDTKASVCGYVFTDCNGDGHLTPGIDLGMSNVLVTLKNSAGVIVASNLTDALGAYCFHELTPGTYTVSIPGVSNCVQTAGCHINHWLDNNNNDCWVENDGYQHWKGADGVDCWNANDGYQHSKNSYGQDCWKDKYGNNHSQNCSYTSCNVPKNNCETFVLAACDAKTSVNFAYQGVSAKAVCTVTGPSKGVCGQTGSYTCTVSNTGSACFTQCQVTACGKTYNCPSLRPGEHCSFQINYQYQGYDYGNFNCQATASCSYAASGTPCSAKSSCSTSVSRY